VAVERECTFKILEIKGLKSIIIPYRANVSSFGKNARLNFSEASGVFNRYFYTHQPAEPARLEHKTNEKLSVDETTLITSHLSQLQKSFRKYYPEPKKKTDWIRNPFSVNLDKLELNEKEEVELIEIRTNKSNELMFAEMELPSFWAYIAEVCPNLSPAAVRLW